MTATEFPTPATPLQLAVSVPDTGVPETAPEYLYLMSGRMILKVNFEPLKVPWTALVVEHALRVNLTLPDNLWSFWVN